MTYAQKKLLSPKLQRIGDLTALHGDPLMATGSKSLQWILAATVASFCLSFFPSRFVKNQQTLGFIFLP